MFIEGGFSDIGGPSGSRGFSAPLVCDGAGGRDRRCAGLRWVCWDAGGVGGPALGGAGTATSFAVLAGTTVTNSTTRPTSTTLPTSTTKPGGGGGNGGEIIPGGHPNTGAGGASHSGNSDLVALGCLALVGAGVAMDQAIRRRRVPVGYE